MTNRNRLTLNLHACGAAMLICTLLPLPAIAEEADVSGGAKPVCTMPFELAFDTPVLPIRINDSRVIRCVLDTGMPEGVFIMNPAAVEGVELNVVQQAKVTGAGGGFKMANLAMGATVQLGDLKFADQRVIVLTEPDGWQHIGVDGAIGTTVLEKYIAQLDFAENVVSFLEPATFSAEQADAVLPLEFVGGKTYVQAQINVRGDELSTVTLMLDTGAARELSVNGMLDSPDKKPVGIEGVLSSGMGGDVMGVVGRTAELRLGKYVLHDIVTEFPSEVSYDQDGTLGISILRRFRVTIDYPGKRLLLKPNDTFDDAFEYDMSGLVLRPNDAGRLRVHHVCPQSPASEAGVRVGDILVRVDGEELSPAELAKRRELLMQPGKTVTLSLDRDGESIKVALTLRRLI